MTLRRKGSLFALLVLVLAGIFVSFGTAHSQFECPFRDITYEEAQNALMSGDLGAGTAALISSVTAEEWQAFTQSDFVACLCSALQLLESQDISEEQYNSELLACLPDIPVMEASFDLTVGEPEVHEANRTVMVTMEADGLTVPSSVSLNFGGSTADRGMDYDVTDEPLTLTPSNTSDSIRVEIRDDLLIEENETIVITATVTGGETGPVQIGPETIFIIDNDEVNWSLEVDDASIDEDEGTARVTVSTGGVMFPDHQAITLEFDGAATWETDYDATTSLTLLAGETSVSTTVTAREDTDQEGNENIEITAQHNGEIIDAPRTIMIVDNDEEMVMPQLTFAVDSTSIREDEGTARVIVSTDGGRFDDAQVISLMFGGNATRGTDYDAAATLTLPAGDTSAFATVTAREDTDQEGNENIEITARHNGQVIEAMRTIVIVDNDEEIVMPVLEFTVDATAINEAEDTATVTVEAVGGTFQDDETIILEIGGTAIEDADFAVADPELILRARQASVSTTVTAVEDTIQEGSETITIAAQRDGETIGTVHTIMITDNDTVELTLSVDETSIEEAGEIATVTVEAVGGTFETDERIFLEISGTADEATDYVIAEHPLTLEAGETSVSTTVTALEDSYQEGNETITITAQHGGATVGVSRTITITEAEPAPPATREVVEETLEAVVASTISNVSTNIGTRFSAARGGTAVTVAGRRIPFAESALALAAFGGLSESSWFEGDDRERRGRDMTLSRLLETSSFQVALAANDEGPQAAQPLQSLTVWGRVDRMFFDRESGDANRYDGDLSAGYVGLDTWLDDRWLIGAAASVTKVKAGYGLDDGGKLDLSMVGLHPYLRLAVDDLSEVWVILGVSLGKIQNMNPGESEREKSDITMTMGAAGLRRHLATLVGIDFALLGDAGYGRLKSGGREGLQVVDNLTADSWRARLGFSGSHTVQLQGLATFTPFVEVVGRYDGGGDENGGVEIAGGIQYANPVSGIGFELRANVLPVYSDEDYREYGFSLSASASPGIGGEGLAMLVATSLGPESGSTEAMLRRKLFGPVAAADDLADALSLNAEVGYGFPIVGSRTVLAPFGGLRLRDGGSREMRTGMRLSRMAAAAPWNLELAGEQRESDYRDTEYLLSLLGRVQF